jgi:hypothetical protein
MSDLDTKLRGIQRSLVLEAADQYLDDYYTDGSIAQIKAAFESEGYAHYETVIQKEVNDQLQGIHEYYQEVYMSGQQFYDRFKAELDKTPDLETHFDTGADFLRHAAILEQVHEAVKRAAGLPTEGEG